ncbi:MAG: Gldg family protein [Clostridia bacterium]|nr:Gldg family protein [Clostridia bacterium]
MKKSVFQQKKFKYGGTAVALTVVVVAVVLLINVIFTSLASTFSLYSDLTGASIYSITDKFVQAMNDLTSPDGGEQSYVNIVILMDEDEFKGYNAYTGYVYRTIKQTVQKCKNVELISKNIVKNPAEKSRYQLNDADPVYGTDVVIELADKNHNPLSDDPAYRNSYKRYAIDSFFSTTTSSSGTRTIYGYNAEVAFLSAVDRLINNSDRPTAYWLQGHGEPTFESSAAWADLLDQAGYAVKEINLASEDFPYEENSKHNSDVLIINCPVFDLYVPTEDDPDIVSEAKKIRRFLQVNYGNLIVAEDSSTPTLYALEEILSEWNLGYGASVTDSSHSVSSSGAVKIFADLGGLSSTNTMANGLLSRLIDSEETRSKPAIIFSNPKSVIIQNDNDGDGASDQKSANNTDGMLVATNSGRHGACEILKSYSTAVSGDEKGAVSLAGMAYVTWDRNDPNGTYSCVFTFGSGTFVDDSDINKSIMNIALSYINRNQSVSYEGIGVKKFDNEALNAVSTSAANAWTIVCVVVIPVIILGFGTFVWIRRRRS